MTLGDRLLLSHSSHQPFNNIHINMKLQNYLCHYILSIYSEQSCSESVPGECLQFIPYTSSSSELEVPGSPGNLSVMIQEAASNCTDDKDVTLAMCTFMYPRCLLSSAVYPCRQTCYGKFIQMPLSRDTDCRD